MSILHAQHAQHAQHVQGGQDGGDASLLATALLRAREGITGSETVSGVAGRPPDLSPGQRLWRLSPGLRSTVLLAELLSDLDTSDDGAARATTATLLVRLADGGQGALVGLSRPTDADLARDVELVGNYADLRAERLPEILAQSADLLPFFGTIEYLHPSRSAATLALLGLALDLATAASQALKLRLACPRPIAFAPALQPPIPTPEHASHPSGHATQAFAVAAVLAALAEPGARPAADSLPLRMAARIAANRTVAGVHFPADSAAGALLGLALGRLMAARAGGGGEVAAVRFHGEAYHDEGASRDFHFAEVHALASGGDPAVEGLPAVSVRPAPLLGWLWAEARTERERRWT